MFIQWLSQANTSSKEQDKILSLTAHMKLLPDDLVNYLNKWFFYFKKNNPKFYLLIAFFLVFSTEASLALAEEVLTTQSRNRSISAMPSIGSQAIRAQLTPKRYTTIAAEIAAKIELLPLPESGRFKRGQELVRFDCALQRAQMEKAKAAQFAAEQTLFANTRLHELGSVGKLELDLSEADLNKAKAELASNRAVLSKCSVSAPYGGRIAEQKVREEQYVQLGQPLLEILDDSVLEFEFIVPSRWLAWIKQGSAFMVHIDETGKHYPAKVLRIGARIDPVSQSVKIVGAINGSFSELIAGMGGSVDISADNNSR